VDPPFALDSASSPHPIDSVRTVIQSIALLWFSGKAAPSAGGQPARHDCTRDNPHPGCVSIRVFVPAAAKLLKAREASLQGTVRLVFQPAEEGPGGAVEVVRAGVLEGVAGVSGLHVWPTTPSGTITTKVRCAQFTRQSKIFREERYQTHVPQPAGVAVPTTASGRRRTCSAARRACRRLLIRSRPLCRGCLCLLHHLVGECALPCTMRKWRSNTPTMANESRPSRLKGKS